METSLMKLSNIKRGDILVAHYAKINTPRFKRHSITFIASGEEPIVNDFGGWLSIPVLALINLQGELFVANKDDSFTPTIGYMYKDATRPNLKPTILSKPELKEVLELLNMLTACGYKYNKKTKEIENCFNETI
jgi:hypothetical protein